MLILNLKGLVLVIFCEIIPIQLAGFTQDVPDKTYHANRRHFFSQPRADLVSGGRFIQKDPEYKSPFENKKFKAQYQLFLGI
jgi:hypothetical protein